MIGRTDAYRHADRSARERRTYLTVGVGEFTFSRQPHKAAPSPVHLWAHQIVIQPTTTDGARMAMI
jgi:hypothetical protein